ncbi:Oxidoreductase [Macleaya cordata]|uniref:Oxidoreductase n=1 Tax=Macleaya cordata TaxID=56857 RepID=A0A200R904_MACCD|nr:Oxidoreductase [Macleaya cordata]
MGEKQIRFGIIGCAQIARKVSRAINLAVNSTLYAIGSRSIEKAKKFAIENGLSDSVKIYGSYDEVLDDPYVDAVCMPLPTSLHVQWAVSAAKKKKHLLLEKPTALDTADLDQILEACKSNGVQFMDGTMWVHHPRTAKIKEMLSDNELFGKLKSIHTTSTFYETDEFLENNIRVKPDLDALGALGDVGWYCIGAILWATNNQLPKTVTALPALTRNQAGVILACGCSFNWVGEEEEDEVATFYCSFLSNVSMDLSIYGTNGTIHVKDFIIPYQENSASFDYTSGAKFTELHLGWNVKPNKVEVASEVPQETVMVQDFARLVGNIKNHGGSPDDKWPEISRKIQLVMDAVNKSIDLGFKPVDL